MKFKVSCPYTKFIGPQSRSSVCVLLSTTAFSLWQQGQAVATDTVWPTKSKSFTTGSCGESWPTQDLTLKIWTCIWCTPEFANPDVASGARHVVKMGEILGAFPHGLCWIVLCPLKGTEIQHFTKHCASRTMCVCRKPGFSLGLIICSPLRPPTSLTQWRVYIQPTLGYISVCLLIIDT